MIAGGVADADEKTAEGPVGIPDVFDQPVPQVYQGLGRQILGAGLAGLAQGLDPLKRLLMLCHVRREAFVAVEPHERFLGREVHLGEIDKLVEDGREHAVLSPGSERTAEAVEKIQLQMMFPVNLRRAGRESGRGFGFASCQRLPPCFAFAALA